MPHTLFHTLYKETEVPLNKHNRMKIYIEVECNDNPPR